MMKQSVETGTRKRFEVQGFLEPRRLFTAAECRELKTQLLKAPLPLDWPKGHAANSAAFAQLGRDPRIVDQVVELIGDDVLLWGASIVARKSGQVHHWHTDIETSHDSDGMVSVWIGLENTRAESSLFLLPGSHHFGTSIQQQAYEATKGGGEVTEDDVRAWARGLGADGEIVQPPASDGEALFFDGRLWHGSDNASQGAPRLAVLLQYARPDIPIRMPVAGNYEYPFRLKEEPRPPCIMVHGSTDSDANRIVPAPGALPNESLSWSRSLVLAGDEVTGFKAHGIYYGATRCLTYLDCHASVLSPGSSPHEPHTHPEEEILVVIDGGADLEVVGGEGRVERHAVQKGSFAYYPVGQAHTIRNVSDKPVVYLMFKWSGARPGTYGGAEAGSGLKTTIHANPVFVSETSAESSRGFAATHLFRAPTGQLTALQCHHSLLAPGGGYEPHVDAYDVGIVLLEGSLETLGQRIDSPSVIFYSAGDPHGMRNPGDETASYLVFEFHGVSGGRASVPMFSGLLRRVPRGIRGLVPSGLRRVLKRWLLG